MLMASYGQIDQVDTDQSRQRTRKKGKSRAEQGLPENFNYADTGCELAPSCLECPLAICKYDDPTYGERHRTTFRDREITRLRLRGMKVSDIAMAVGTSERTVYRITKRYGAEVAAGTLHHDANDGESAHDQQATSHEETAYVQLAVVSA